MSSIKFSNILLETNSRSVNYPSLYVQADHPVVPSAEDAGIWVFCGKGRYDFTTFFNALSVAKLRKYTTATAFALHLELRGAAGDVQQMMGDAFASRPLPVEDNCLHFNASKEWQTIDLPLQITDEMILVGFEVTTEGQVELRNGYYTLELSEDPRPVELALSTTTFKKEKYITSNVNLIKTHIVESGDDIADHFHMYVMDNGRTLDARALSGDRITVIPSDNVGGAGGFTHGMIAAMEQKPKATHILLMDDDVAVSPESIKRTYNLLRILKPEYQDYTISGAMMDYEIGEDQCEDVGFITDRGEMAPCKPTLRMTQFVALIYNEIFRPTKEMRQHNQYAGWWYCCIPIDVIERNGLPLPFFVRCDDTEYGTRCGSKFITMNSICVWHMSFAERYNVAVERYQAIRNELMAKAICNFAPNADFMAKLHNDLRLELKKFGYQNAEVFLDAFEDFLKGPSFLARPGQVEESFMAANRNKEQLVGLAELQKQADKDPELAGFDVTKLDRPFVDGDKPRSIFERLDDYVTDNRQRFVKSSGHGYAVIPYFGWVYPAGVIRGKDKLVVIDWYNRKGAIRKRDNDRYARIKRRYQRDLQYYRTHKSQLEKEYADSRTKFISEKFWKHYLKID